MNKTLDYQNVLQALRDLGYQVGTKHNPHCINCRAHAVARALAGKVVEGALLPHDIKPVYLLARVVDFLAHFPDFCPGRIQSVKQVAGGLAADCAGVPGPRLGGRTEIDP